MEGTNGELNCIIWIIFKLIILIHVLLHYKLIDIKYKHYKYTRSLLEMVFVIVILRYFYKL